MSDQPKPDQESGNPQESNPTKDRPSPITSDHLFFGLAGVFLGVIIGYTVAFQVHSPGRPGFDPPSRPNPSEMQSGSGVNVGGAQERAPFINEDGSIDMDKVPEDMKTHMAEAKTMLEQHKKILEEDPNNVDILLTVGRFYASLGMDEKGLTYFERAVEAGPERTDVRTELGRLFYDSGRYAEAAEVLKEASSLSEGDPDILNQLALAHLRMDEVEEAIRILDQAAEANPEHLMCRFNAAVIHLFARRDADAAQKSLDEARKLVPEGDHQVEMMSEAIQRFRETGELPSTPGS